jgi:opacity protein-like surface antigen
MYLFQKAIFSILAGTVIIYAGGAEDVVPQSPIAPILESEPLSLSYYLGAGISYQTLNNQTSDEAFKSYMGTVLGGIKIGNYLGVEGRYSGSIFNMRYEEGDTQNIGTSDFNANLSSLSAFLRMNTNNEMLNPYILLGYGVVELDAILLSQGKAKITEESFQYGVGVEVKITKNSTLFIDYVHLYDDVGFDGKAIYSDVYSGETTIGFTYNF